MLWTTAGILNTGGCEKLSSPIRIDFFYENDSFDVRDDRKAKRGASFALVRCLDQASHSRRNMIDMFISTLSIRSETLAVRPE